MKLATETAAGDKLLVYDGDCPMCQATIAWLLGRGLVPPEQTRSHYELSGDELAAAQRAGIRNQLVVIARDTGETRAGSDGLLWIVGARPGFHPLVRLLGLPGVRQLLRYAYETISYNRRVISPPRQQIVCDCEPEVTVARRLVLIVPLVLASIAIAAGFGAAVFASWQIGGAGEGAVFLPIAMGGGWIVMAAAGLVLLRGFAKIDYVAHLAVTMFAGALLLLPAALVTSVLPRSAAVALDCLAVAASLAVMFAMQRKRVAAIGLSSAWLWAWTVVVIAALAGSVLSHFRERMF